MKSALPSPLLLLMICCIGSVIGAVKLSVVFILRALQIDVIEDNSQDPCSDIGQTLTRLTDDIARHRLPFRHQNDPVDLGGEENTIGYGKERGGVDNNEGKACLQRFE